MQQKNNKSAVIGETSNRLTRSQGLAYGLPLLSLYFLMGPVTLLQGIYAKYFGLALTTIASVLLVARLFDAVSDPVIGYCADRYYDHHGNRKPFIIFGAVLFVVSSWFLYVPYGFDSAQGCSSVSTVYFLGWFLVFYLGFTLFEVPHLAWGSVLASDSQGRNTVYGVRSFFLFLGSLLFFAMPLLPWFGSSEFTPQTLKWSVLGAGALMLPLLYYCIKHVPSRSSIVQGREYLSRQPQKSSPYLVLRTVVSNRPFLILTAAQICTGLGSGMWFTLLFIFVDAYLKLGQYFAATFAVSFGLSLLALRLWFVLANRWGKQYTWSVGMILVVIGIIGTGLLSPETAGWIELLLCMTLVLSGYAAFNIMVPSLLSDIIDYGTWKFGSDRAATYFSVYTFINKSVGALGGSLGLAIAGWAGFDMTQASHSDGAVVGLRVGIAWIPVVFTALSIAFIIRIPITARRHAIIRRFLSRVERGAKSNKTKVDNLENPTSSSPLLNT